MDREKVMSWLEGLAQPDWHKFHSDTEVQVIAESALALLKEQEAVYPSWQNGKMYCGHCGSKFPPRVGMRFCHRCGMPIKLKVNDIVEQEGR